MGLNSALSVARNALEIFSTAIEVSGNNVANANTPGYIREELQLETSKPYAKGTFALGSGVVIGGVRQQVDAYLETRLHAAGTAAANAAAVNDVYKRLEAELRELGEGDLSTSLNDFLAGVNDVVNQPESLAIREVAVQRGEQLARDIVNLRTRVDGLREEQSAGVDSLVAEANALISQIKDLNPQIAKFEAGGQLKSDAGALRGQRYEALRRLAEIVPVRYHENANGSVDVYSRDDYLILGQAFQTLEIESTVDRGISVQRVTLSNTNADITNHGGELAGIAYGRDTVLGGFVDDLDAFATGIVSQFNRLHASGQGLQGFESLTAANAVNATTSILNVAGLPSTPVHGGFRVKVTNTATGQASTVDINVDLDGIGHDDDLDDLQAKLDAITELSATITTDGRLSLSASAGYEFTFADDSSNILASLGLNTFFKGTDSATIGVNAVVKGDTRHFAAALGGGPSDGRNAIRLAEFQTTALDSPKGLSIDGHYRNTVTRIAQSSASQGAIVAGRNGFRESLGAQRAQISGVSIDEEAIKILELQRSFQAAARVISTVDDLFTTLLNM